MQSADTPADIFFHAKDWVGGSERPAEGLLVVYEEIHVGGKGPRGVAVRPVGQGIALQSRKSRSSSRRSAEAADGHAAPMIVLMVAYAVFLGWAAYAGRVSVAAALAVLPVSAVTFLAYWRDKGAAERGAWRTSEQTLHVMSLIGGWPGAWFAQRLLRTQVAREVVSRGLLGHGDRARGRDHRLGIPLTATCAQGSAFVVLPAAAACASRWVLLGVEGKLRLRCLVQVDAEYCRHPNQVEQHVGELFTGACEAPSVLRYVPRLLFSEPLEDLGKLAHLSGQRHDEVLRRVELLPVSFARKRLQRLGEPGRVDESG
jgi:uncharacterized membrane protein YsdA (DUF1294 family)